MRRAAAFALGKLKFEDVKSAEEIATVGSALSKKIVDKDPLLRANAYEALLRFSVAVADRAPKKPMELLGAALADKDAGVRCALLGVAGDLFPDQAEARAAAALKDPDWRPRMQAVDILGATKTTSALRLLIDALSDARPAVVARATRNLQELTGEKHTRKEAWEIWWKEKGGGFDFSTGRHADARTADSTVAASFNGIQFESDHTAFLIDTSKDMADQLKSQDCTKAEAALKELENTLARRRGNMRFSLFTYAREITPFSKKGAVDLDAKSQEKALAFVKDQRLEGSKDIWQALDTVLADTDVDTVFLLSSGEPEVGTYVHWNRIAWHLAEQNRLRKVVVHAIAYSEKQWYRDQLEHIARVTGGEFKFFE